MYICDIIIYKLSQCQIIQIIYKLSNEIISKLTFFLKYYLENLLRMLLIETDDDDFSAKL